MNSMDRFICGDRKLDVVTYFETFGIEHIPKEIKKFIGNKIIKTNIYRTQAYDSIMCRHFCIGLISFLLKGKSLADFTNWFSLNNFKSNSKVILNIF